MNCPTCSSPMRTRKRFCASTPHRFYSDYRCEQCGKTLSPGLVTLRIPHGKKGDALQAKTTDMLCNGYVILAQSHAATHTIHLVSLEFTTQPQPEEYTPCLS